MSKISFSVPGILPSSSSQQLPVPSGYPAALSGGLDVTGKAAIEVGFNLFLGVAVVIAVVMLIFGGIQWTTSGGDPAKVSSARKKITFSIIGLVVTLLAFVIVSFIYNFLTGQPNDFLKLGN